MRTEYIALKGALCMLTQKLIRKLLEEFIEACKKAPSSIVKVILFGSVARGDFYIDSDIDILVISKNLKEAKNFFGKIADDLFLKYFVPISIVYVEPDRLLMNDRFIQGVLEEGKVLWVSKRMK